MKIFATAVLALALVASAFASTGTSTLPTYANHDTQVNCR